MSSPKLSVSVILCTYNRSQSLRKALESVNASDVPPSISWEVLVVDNNSTDATRQVIQEFCAAYPDRFRYHFEGRQGKSHALNSGIQQARGMILVFTDDDVTVEPQWLVNLVTPLADTCWTGAGGRVLPTKGFVPPAWLSEFGPYALAPFALFEPRPDLGEISEAPFGANMALRKSVFADLGGFRTDLGPAPGSEIRNEDTEFGHRLMSAGLRLVYVPSAVVYHDVPPKRLGKQYHLRWWFDKGRADIREFGRPKGAQLSGVPVVFLKRALKWGMLWIVTPQSNRRFARKLKLWTNLGAIKESSVSSTRS